ncbi:hypothetical protein LZK98_13985 [Sphingomonas cannabina]|uniref:hypothetical protein n=1 Tax=Sphingomonas cannabina TaxID=2899123 RepID=UPI001F42ACE7|nr:hypothetical protein [Sphingomonas cannabina]UIJ44180.1 hypothetical protein LZK98_13985 [Sphingomonas cannabina]
MRATGPIVLLAALLLAGFSQSPSMSAASAADLKVRVTVSRAAQAKLSAGRELILVDASFYGDPAPAARRHADESGRVPLLNRIRTLPATGGIATFPLGEIPRARRRWIRGPIKVNVNVYSARRSSPDNILACDFMDGPLPAPSRMPVELRCSLIAEGTKTRFVS